MLGGKKIMEIVHLSIFIIFFPFTFFPSKQTHLKSLSDRVGDPTHLGPRKSEMM
jgi:hypothetical protein